MHAKKPKRRKRNPKVVREDWPPGWTEEDEREFQEAGSHVYDKADWHIEGDFPKRLPKKQAFVHTGFFTGWLIAHRMISLKFLRECSRELSSAVDRFKRRALTGPEVYEMWGGVLLDDMLTSPGNQFAQAYYENNQFVKDYQKLLARRLPSFYHVEDTWTNYEAIASCIDARYEAWRCSHRKSKRRESPSLALIRR